MSPSRFANKGADPASLNRLDLLLAVLLHALVIILIAVLTYLKGQHQPEPMQRIDVMMISAKELAEMMQPHPKQQPAPKVKVKPKPKPEPKPIPKPEPKPAPAPKPAPPKPAPKPQPKAAAKQPAKAKPAKAADTSFDPFAPVASSSDTTKPARTRSPDMADIAGKQLTASEKEKYTALIQDAVARNWKVAASVKYNKDPVVELRLRPNGEVDSVRIIQSSGNAELDASLERAIRAAAPFQVPPGLGFEYFRDNTITFRPLQ